MKLYKVSRDEKLVGYDEYLEAVICARHMDEALSIGRFMATKPDEILTATFIGTAGAKIKKGCVMDSFNAG